MFTDDNGDTISIFQVHIGNSELSQCFPRKDRICTQYSWSSYWQHWDVPAFCQQVLEVYSVVWRVCSVDTSVLRSTPIILSWPRNGTEYARCYWILGKTGISRYSYPRISKPVVCSLQIAYISAICDFQVTPVFHRYLLAKYRILGVHTSGPGDPVLFDLLLRYWIIPVFMNYWRCTVDDPY